MIMDDDSDKDEQDDDDKNNEMDVQSASSVKENKNIIGNMIKNKMGAVAVDTKANA